MDQQNSPRSDCSSEQSNLGLFVCFSSAKEFFLTRIDLSKSSSGIFHFNNSVSLQAGSIYCFCGHLLIFFKINFFKKKIRNTIRASNGLELDQDRPFCLS